MHVDPIGEVNMAATIGAGDRIRVALLSSTDEGPAKHFREVSHWDLSLPNAACFFAELSVALGYAGLCLAEQLAQIGAPHDEGTPRG